MLKIIPPRCRLCIIFLFACTLVVSAQEQYNPNRDAALTIYGRSNDSAKVARFNIGLIGRTDSVHGVQANFLMSNASEEMKGMQMSGISNLARGMSGLQVAAFTNISTSALRGVQLAGINNIAMGVRRGIQLSAFSNICASYMRGLQIGSYSYADSLNGTQIGLINICRTHPRGVQVGLINVSRDTIAHKIGLVNVNPNTRIDVLLYGGTSTKVNFALRFRNRSTYNIIGAGTHFMGLDEKFSGALFYRIGQYFQLDRRWSIGGDVGFYHVETFQHHTTQKPQRLYSLQARLNVDCQLSPSLSAFATVGYGDTHYYYHQHRYRSRMLGELGLAVRFDRRFSVRSFGMSTDDVANDEAKDNHSFRLGSRPFRAAVETAGINLLVHSFDRWVMNEEFAQVNLHTIHHNVKNGFVWDNDQFSTNLFAHPYHGNLYYNSARSNGLSFYLSLPYALCGSFMWETCGEIEPPAINDLIATTVGGICIGEITHRISKLILNDSSRGMRRFLREAAAAIVNPMGALNRIIDGKAWHVDTHASQSNNQLKVPVDFSLSLGTRYLADDGALFRGEGTPYVNLFLEYGDPFCSDCNRPYDFFYAEAIFGMSRNQPLINALHLMGRIWGAPALTGTNFQAEVGIYQHFNYYDSKPVKDGTQLTPYRISEAASVGPGIIYCMPSVGSLSRLEQRIFLTGILLGGTKSDYYNVIDRDYNMGSGFSVKTKTHMEFRHFGRFILHADYFRIYTWKGYEQRDLTTVDPLYLNAQGDKGHASLLVVNPMWEFDFRGSLSAVISASYFLRNTHYAYYPDVEARTFDIRFGLTCHF